MRIVRAPEDPVTFPLATGSLLAWTMAFNHTLTRAALRAAGTRDYDVIHAHDWLVAHTAVTLAEHLDLPLVTTIHATEAGRHQGWLPDETEPQPSTPSSGGSATTSARVIVCSGYMRGEVTPAVRRCPPAGSTWCPTGSTAAPGGPGRGEVALGPRAGSPGTGR